MSIHDVSPMRVGPFVIGAVDHINGAAAEPSGFVVTKHELESLARYWFLEELYTAFKCDGNQQWGSSDWRICRYSADRLDAIAEVLGNERLEEIRNVAINELQQSVGAEVWRVFTGTEAERKAFFAHEQLVWSQFESNPFEVSIRWLEGERGQKFLHFMEKVLLFMCSPPVFNWTRDGHDMVGCRCATREEADDLMQRLSVLRIPGVDVQVVAR